MLSVCISRSNPMVADGYLPNKRAGSLIIFHEPVFLLYFCGEKKVHNKNRTSCVICIG